MKEIEKKNLKDLLIVPMTIQHAKIQQTVEINTINMLFTILIDLINT